MKIWVDADSCPPKIREIIIRASNRESIETVFVADREIAVKSGPHARFVLVPKGKDAADTFIAGQMSGEDLVITRDIPFADLCVKRGITVLNDRGTVYTKENVGERLSIRHFMQNLRERELYGSGEQGFGKKEVEKFANAFDRELRKKLK